MNLIEAAPVWNIGNNVEQYLAWADNVGPGPVNDALRGMAYLLTTQAPVRPSVRRFVNTATPEAILPWVERIADLNLVPEGAIGFMNQNFRQEPRA